ncbi:MarR family transcriptional regulator [Rhodobacteraceae bacterium WD3A24]|nr:MarR family transcriptional regulator [Rhodobacteraceae bacterium WD3A24]
MSEDSAQAAAELLVHLARLAQGGPDTQDLTPAQWTALRYFARANRASRTPSAFSEFHATTRGTASQTVKSLVALGLLERHASDTDRRSARFEVTEAGRAKLADDPLAALARVLRELPSGEASRFLDTLRTATSELAAARAAPVFGSCNDCTYFEGGTSTGYCHCAEASLLGEELAALCIDYNPRA